jgi:hypothetical protein
MRRARVVDETFIRLVGVETPQFPRSGGCGHRVVGRIREKDSSRAKVQAHNCCELD